MHRVTINIPESMFQQAEIKALREDVTVSEVVCDLLGRWVAGEVELSAEERDDQELAAFMERHDGFELVDQGLAEIVETPEFRRKRVELNPETLQLLDELVASGICVDLEDAVVKAVRSYVLAVLPHAYRLAREI